MEKIVIIGAGQAGASLAIKLRNLGYEGAITMIGEEPVAPYQRPPLSKKYLLGQMELRRMLLRPDTFYTDNNIALIKGKRVDSIDPVTKTVTSGNDSFEYDKLAITTGSEPRRLPAEIGGNLKGVYTVRDLADVDFMASEFVEGRNLLIIGGGYIGLEAAAVAAARGINVTLVEKEDRILQRVACEETSGYFRKLHQQHGVDIRESTGVVELIGKNRISEAVLDDGSRLPVDFVITGIGVVSRSELANSANLETSDGIIVNAQAQSSNPDIYAAGDCATFPYKGNYIRLESVQNAIDQSEIAAAAMLGNDVQYDPNPWFWSDQFDVKLQIAGYNAGYNHVVVRPGDKSHTQSIWYFHGDKLLAVDAMNDPRAYMTGKRMLEAGKSPKKDDISNVSIDLKTLL